MTGAVRYLSDDALVKVAAYYASLDPPRPAAASAKGAPKRRPGRRPARPQPPLARGCHGEVGVSKTPGMPSLVGLDPKYFVAAMKAYKSGQRKHDMMKSLRRRPERRESTNNMALYYALQKPATAQTPAPGDAAAGKAAAAACAGCHGDLGVSGNPATPSLAGQDAEYVVAALRAYKDGSRKDESMKGPAAALDEKAMREPRRVLRGAAAAAAQRAQAAHHRGVDASAATAATASTATAPTRVMPRLAAQRAD